MTRSPTNATLRAQLPGALPDFNMYNRPANIIPAHQDLYRGVRESPLEMNTWQLPSGGYMRRRSRYEPWPIP